MLMLLSLLRLLHTLLLRFVLQLSCFSRKHPDVVDKAPNEKIVVVRFPCQDPTALVHQSLGVQFDLQLVRLGLVLGLGGSQSKITDRTGAGAAGRLCPDRLHTWTGASGWVTWVRSTLYRP